MFFKVLVVWMFVVVFVMIKIIVIFGLEFYRMVIYRFYCIIIFSVRLIDLNFRN